MSEETNTPENQEEKELTEIVQKLSNIAQLLGFQLAIPKPKDDEEIIRGFILGTPEYIDEITKAHATLMGEDTDVEN